MLNRSIISVPFLVCTLAAIGNVNAREPYQDWMKYARGEWTYEMSDGSKGTVTWRQAAKGNANIGRFKDDDGSVAVEIAGWQADTKTLVVTGYNSDGHFWQLDYKKFAPEGAAGPIRGIADGGAAYTGDFTARIVNDDAWEWTLNGKTVDGTELTLSCKLARKRE